MFGDQTLDMMLSALQAWAIEEVESKIEDHLRSIERLRRQKRLLDKIIASYKAAQVKSEKQMKEWQKKSKAAMRKAPKIPHFPMGGVITEVAARKAV